MGSTLSWLSWILGALGTNDPFKKQVLMTSAFRDPWGSLLARTLRSTPSTLFALEATFQEPNFWSWTAQIVAPTKSGRAKEGSQAQTLFLSSQTSLQWKPSTEWNGFPFSCVYLLSPYPRVTPVSSKLVREGDECLAILPSFHITLFECLSSYVQATSLLLKTHSTWYPSSWVFLCRLIL